MRVITWNMEGGSHSQSSKWSAAVQQLLWRAEADVLCIQESGTRPANTRPAAAPPWRGGGPPGGITWSYVEWRPGRIAYELFWVQTDPGGNRVNLAVITTASPSGLWYIPEGLPAGRPSIGVNVGGENVFSLHALSGSGNDAPGLIANIDHLVPGNEEWNAAGDFNRQPPWGPPAGHLCPPNHFTRWKSKTKIDYMVRTQPAMVGMVIDSLVLSDHFPVLYDV